MWYVLTDSDGNFNGFYNNEFQKIPDGARPISDEYRQEWMNAGRDAYHWPHDEEKPIEKSISDEDKLISVKTSKQAEMRAACAEAIISGYTSDALGEPYLYPTTELDTQNLGNSVLSAIYAKMIQQDANWKTQFWNMKVSDNTWAFRDHTADQIIQVGEEVKSFIVGLQQHYADLLDQINSAPTEAQVLTLHW